MPQAIPINFPVKMDDTRLIRKRMHAYGNLPKYSRGSNSSDLGANERRESTRDRVLSTNALMALIVRRGLRTKPTPSSVVAGPHEGVVRGVASQPLQPPNPFRPPPTGRRQAPGCLPPSEELASSREMIGFRNDCPRGKPLGRVA